VRGWPRLPVRSRRTVAGLPGERAYFAYRRVQITSVTVVRPRTRRRARPPATNARGRLPLVTRCPSPRGVPGAPHLATDACRACYTPCRTTHFKYRSADMVGCLPTACAMQREAAPCAVVMSTWIAATRCMTVAYRRFTSSAPTGTRRLRPGTRPCRRFHRGPRRLHAGRDRRGLRRPLLPRRRRRPCWQLHRAGRGRAARARVLRGRRLDRRTVRPSAERDEEQLEPVHAIFS